MTASNLAILYNSMFLATEATMSGRFQGNWCVRVQVVVCC